MKSLLLASFIIALLFNNSYGANTHPNRNNQRNLHEDESSSSNTIVIPNAINNATATIIFTAPSGDIPAKTWISFDDGPLVEVDDDLSLEAIEGAYDKAVRKHADDNLQRHSYSLLEPFSFESPYADPVCIFNKTIVKANVTGPTTLSCESPPIDNPRGAAVPFRISSNGGHDVSSARSFIYLAAQERESLVLEPNHGPSSGGTHVYVRGITSGPIANGPLALCKFGKHISDAIEVGSEGEYVVCLSPPWSANDYDRSVTLDISIAGQINVFSGVGVVFRYDDEFSISSLHPPSGLVIGGTNVAVRGGPFQNPDEIVCRFGTKVVAAKYHDLGEISCVSPNLGWIDETQRVSVFTMAANPSIQTIRANVDDYVNEVHVCHTYAETEISDDELGRGFRLVAPGGSIDYPLTRHTRWLHFNETAEGFENALDGLFPDGFSVTRTGPFANQAYRWEIVLPKNDSFNGETLHVVNTGGGAVKLTGENATISCVLEHIGTTRLGGSFKLSFSSNDSVETTRPIAHKASNDEIKAALEELDGIDVVKVNSGSLDTNLTGSGANEWHVTFDSLKNAGNIPLLNADYSSTLLGSNAAINTLEARHGSSHAVFRIDVPSQAVHFVILFDGIAGQILPVGASEIEVMESIEAIGGKSIVVQKYRDEYFIMDIMGYPIDERFQVKILRQCSNSDDPQSCQSEVYETILHVPATVVQLGGYFGLEYPSAMSSCKSCRHSTGLISAFATADELEVALHKLELVDKVKVVVTASIRFEEYKVAVESGIVGFCRNFYIHFLQNEFSSSNPMDTPMHSTSFSGDIPMLSVIHQASLKGTPTRDSAYSNEYSSKVIEVVKGTDLNHGGIVELAVSVSVSSIILD